MRGLRPALLLAALLWAGLAGAQTVTLTQFPVDLTSGSDAPPPVVELDTPADAGAQMGILVLDVDQAYVGSAWGRRAQADLAAAAREIEAENTRLEAQLTAEEQALTAERTSLSPAEFRQKAEAFDSRAQTVRRERRQAAVDLGNRAQADRNAFVDATLPIIAAIMKERRAGVVLDRRQTLLSINSADITAELVARMDETVGDGGSLPPPPPADAGDASAGTDETAPAE